VLPMMRATFLGTVVANVAIVNCWLAVGLSLLPAGYDEIRSGS
jgi:hypothetical protein